MNKITIFTIILLASVALGAIDFISNGYTEKLGLKASIQDFVKMNNSYVERLQTIDSEIKLKEKIEAKTIFNKINLEKIDGIKSATELLFTKNNLNYLKLYTFQFESSQNQVNYLKIKNLFSNLNNTQPHITINEVNNYGANSFYLNDTQEGTMARLVILTPESVIGVEYSKTINKESVEPLLSILTTN